MLLIDAIASSIRWCRANTPPAVEWSIELRSDHVRLSFYTYQHGELFRLDKHVTWREVEQFNGGNLMIETLTQMTKEFEIR